MNAYVIRVQRDGDLWKACIIEEAKLEDGTVLVRDSKAPQLQQRFQFPEEAIMKAYRVISEWEGR